MLMVVPCCCGGCTTTINGKIIGCNSLGLPSVSVEAHDATAGGTLLATTTTDSGGNYTFAGITGVSGNAIVIVPVSLVRFTAVNRTLTWTSGATPTSSQWGCGKTTPAVNTVQTVATGYFCFSGCAYPVAATLHGTDTWFGSFTLVNTGSGWLLSPGISYSYPGCFGCPAKTVTVTFSSIEWHWKATFAGCPDDTASSPCNTVFGGLITCFIPGVSAFGITGTWPAGSSASSCLASMFCNNSASPPSQTTTLTE
jgi:hypothetical protein